MSFPLQKMFIVRFKSLDIWQIPRVGLIPKTLPKGWRVVRIGDIAQQVTERVRVEPGKLFKMLGVRWYGEGVFLRETVQGNSMSAAWVTPAKPGAFIYNRLFAWKESFAVVPPELEGCFVSNEFPQFVLNASQVSAEYLDLLFRLPSVIAAVNAASAGSAAVSRNRFKESELLRMELPLPPIESQRAIIEEWKVAKAEIAAAEERIVRIGAEIEGQFFASLGLTAPAKVKSPKCFVARWRDSFRWSVSYNQTALTGTDISKGKFPIVPLGSILDLVQYGTSEKANIKGQGTAVVRMNNIKNGVLDLSDLKHIDLPNKERERLFLQDGDILFNRTNSKELVGKCAVFHTQGDYVFASYIIRVRVMAEKASSDYVAFVLNSLIGRKQIDAMSRQIIGQANINSQELRTMQIPLPPLNVQFRIVEQIGDGWARIASERKTVLDTAELIKGDLGRYLLGTKEVCYGSR